MAEKTRVYSTPFETIGMFFWRLLRHYEGHTVEILIRVSYMEYYVIYEISIYNVWLGTLVVHRCTSETFEKLHISPYNSIPISLGSSYYALDLNQTATARHRACGVFQLECVPTPSDVMGRFLPKKFYHA